MGYRGTGASVEVTSWCFSLATLSPRRQPFGDLLVADLPTGFQVRDAGLDFAESPFLGLDIRCDGLGGKERF